MSNSRCSDDNDQRDIVAALCLTTSADDILDVTPVNSSTSSSRNINGDNKSYIEPWNERDCFISLDDNNNSNDDTDKKALHDTPAGEDWDLEVDYNGDHADDCQQPVEPAVHFENNPDGSNDDAKPGRYISLFGDGHRSNPNPAESTQYKSEYDSHEHSFLSYDDDETDDSDFIEETKQQHENKIERDGDESNTDPNDGAASSSPVGNVFMQNIRITSNTVDSSGNSVTVTTLSGLRSDENSGSTSSYQQNRGPSNYSSDSSSTLNNPQSRKAAQETNVDKNNSAESEWDKVLQSGRAFTGRADADVFATRTPITTATPRKLHHRPQGGQMKAAHRRCNSISSNPSTSSNQIHHAHPPLNSVPEEDQIGTGNNNDHSVVPNENQTQALVEKIESHTVHQRQGLPPPPPIQYSNDHEPQNTSSVQGSTSQTSPPQGSLRNPTITITTQTSPRRGSNNNQFYPLSLQHRPLPMQQRRTSLTSVASTATGPSSVVSGVGVPRSSVSAGGGGTSVVSSHSYNTSDHLSAGVLPDVLLTVRQKIESMTLFDSDILRLMSADYRNADGTANDDDPTMQESRESLKRSSQQSISASVLVSLAHKRYERRRLAAMEIEKVVRSLVAQHQQQNIKRQQQTGVNLMKKNGTMVSSPVGDMALDRIRAILLLLSDDYVRSTSEDARKGGVVALAACAIGLKKADDTSPAVQECRDLILASVVHACQDHSQRVRYYATESLFNVVKVIPSLAVQHFFILFEILRSLYADVDVDVRSGAELLDKKLKEIIVGAMNAGIFTSDACVPVFSRFVFMKHKATKRLTLTWLQELNEKLIGSPILEFLHLFLGGIFDMVADPTVAIRQSALAFLQSVLPKLLVVKHDVDNNSSNSNANAGVEKINGYNSMFDNMEDIEMNVVDFDKILQSLVTTMEHPNPFVRKVAMYWMSRIVKAHMAINITPSIPKKNRNEISQDPIGMSSEVSFPPHFRNDSNGKKMTHKETASGNLGDENKKSPRRGPSITSNGYRRTEGLNSKEVPTLSAASIAVRNSVPHVLPGILLSIGDNYHYNSNNNPLNASAKDAFLPDQTTRDLAEQTNACLQEAVRRDGSSYVQHLDGFIVALREELDSPGGFTAKNSPAVYRTPYRMDVLPDGTGVETAGWFRSNRDGISKDKQNTDDSIVMSRLCALDWVIVLYESVVPDVLKADYAREFIFAVIHQLADNPPQTIVYKSLEVLGKITIPVAGEEKPRTLTSHHLNGLGSPAWMASSISRTNTEYFEDHSDSPMSDANVSYALKFLDSSRRRLMSRDREVFSSLVQLLSYNEHLLSDLSNVLTYMCKLQPPAFVMVSFAIELDRFVRRRQHVAESATNTTKNLVQSKGSNSDERDVSLSKDFRFVSSFIQHMNHVLLNTDESKELRVALKDCVGGASKHHGTIQEKDRQLGRLFNILLHAFSHNVAATLSLCLWTGAYRTSYLFLARINPLDINLMCLLELDRLIEMLERPLFRHLHVRMLERDYDALDEGSGAMLFQFLKHLLMILPQSTCYRILRDRLTSLSRFRQSTNTCNSYPLSEIETTRISSETKTYVARIIEIRELHCNATWKTIRQGSLETKLDKEEIVDHGASRLKWLGYASKEEEALRRFRDDKLLSKSDSKIEEIKNNYSDLDSLKDGTITMKELIVVHPEAAALDVIEVDQKRDQQWVHFWTNEDK